MAYPNDGSIYMTIDALLPIISYVLVSTFTPGPSNISSASMGILHGYKNTLRYQAGLAFGVFLLMFLSGWFSAALLHRFPALEPILQYAGAAYILYLAFSILKASYNFTETETKSLGFWHGITLQILNPKLFVYAFTLFAGFLAGIPRALFTLIITAVLLAAISFCSTSVWALFGNAIKSYLRTPRIRMAVNVLLAISLVYAAISLLPLG
ncbi:MAG: LysE family translocator [Anaerolineales bacterium]|nr:LysE family translocator [Anaerolineales bacterium]